MSKKRFKILVIGCGDLGSRHLQAVSALPDVEEITVVDPNPKSLELGKQRLLDVPHRSKETELKWFSSLEEMQGDADLCIMATLAEGRNALIKTIAQRFGVQLFLIEKLVAQSVEDYEALISFAKEKNLSIWVNCQTRANGSHKRIKQNLDPGHPILLNVIGGNHGLATNGVHYADLFCFYDGSDHIQLNGTVIDPLLHPAKRGKGFFDLSGTLLGSSGKGSQFTLSFSGSHRSPPHLSIVSPHYRAIIDDVLGCFYESREASGWNWEKIPYEGDLFVSRMTKDFVADIFEKQACELPTLEECFPAHRFILKTLQPHFGALLKKEISCCPAT